ncbi:MAG: shikimate dehydrogenase, partial [Muribaculaceae bacterium]|nr:shikimate dehydrogenase [Muribaculaceae bacterium]
MYGLIGYPLGHSFSASFFNEKFKKESIDESYSLFPLESIEELPSLLKGHEDLKGLNVTIPYKQKVIDYLDDISDEAKKIGAVNVVKITSEKGKLFLKGHNSDAIGFRNSLLPLLRDDVKKALVLGSGGASKAVIYVLKELGIEVTEVSRHKRDDNITYDELTGEVMASHLLIVNTTPLGMWPKIEEAPKIPYQFVTPSHILYDLVYNPETTEFMRRGLLNGARVKNGLEMLHGQAIAAWEIW